MTRTLRMFIGAILLALVFTVGIVCAADGDEMHADLALSKVVSSDGPYKIDDQVTWVVTVRNNGPANATNITVAEDISHLTGLKNFSAMAGLGTYNTTTHIWTIDELRNASSATLTINTSFTAAGNKTNAVTVTALNETDPILNNNYADATAEINVSEIIPPQKPQADLNVSKVVSSTGPYSINDEVRWVVTVRNNGPANATNITVAEDISHLTGLKNFSAVAGLGTYNTTTHIWTIDELRNASFATLTINTSFTTAGNKTNAVTVTALDETDPILNNNHAEVTVRFNTTGAITPHLIPPASPLSAYLVFKPTTLNLKSRGIFTVYVSLMGAGMTPVAGEGKKPHIDYANSSLTCSGSELVRATVSGKGSGTLVAKFHRADLDNITPNNGVTINCSGTLAVNGEVIPVEGSDTIRVIGEKKGLDKILSRLWRLLGVEKDDVEITEEEDGNLTVILSLNPDTIKNYGQSKKLLKNNDNESNRAGADTVAVPDQTRGGKENPSKEKNETNQVRKNNSNDKPGKGSNGSEKQNDQSPGKSNGNKNT
jgi:uncharacterized repeat protein (TIGR01451 family)